MLDTQAAGIQDQEMQLDPEAKAAMLLDVLEIVFGDLLDQGKDIPLSQLQELKFSFAEDGSVKVSVLSQESPEAQPVEDVSEVSSDKIMAALEEAASDLQLEPLDA